ncbi:MAG: glycosyltransferase family 2 protein [Lachnospiraceae bacterium]|nr:glycosyltransferase family 2 protein [Lachnospiraceae bacterium]
MKVTLVVPCYNEEKNVGMFYDVAESAFCNTSFDYDIVFVNDGSRDNTFAELKKIFKAHSDRVSVVNLSRNFGKEAAILAGLKRASGDYIALVDADLQQRPEIVVDMVNYLEEHEEYDVVAAYQEHRIEGKLMSGVKKLFYSLINKVCDIEFYAGASDFRTFRRSVAEALINMPEYHRFSKGLFSWIGFNTYYLPYVAEERNAGETKWSVKKLMKYALEGFMSFTTMPLRFATYLGMIVSLCAVLYMLFVIIKTLAFGEAVPGYPTIVTLILFLSGVQLLILGILGEYLARIYVQGKNRPVYIEKEFLHAKLK